MGTQFWKGIKKGPWPDKKKRPRNSVLQIFEEDKKGTLDKKGDPNPQQGPLEDLGPLKGTHLVTFEYWDLFPICFEFRLCWNKLYLHT